MKYTVLIPTLGRPSLFDLVQQIAIDRDISQLDVEIVVALNGESVAFLENQEITLLHLSNQPMGVGAAVNKALLQVDEGWVWTIADDENWLPGKFRSDLGHISKLPECSILMPTSNFVDEIGKSKRPRIPIGKGEKVFDYLYSHLHFARSPRYISLSGACALRKTWISAKFPESMQTREDIEYLALQEEIGCKFVHNEQVTVGINVLLSRGALREQNALEALKWAEMRLTEKQRVGFIGCSWVKPLVFSGNRSELRDMLVLINSGESSLSLLNRYKLHLLLRYWSIVSICLQLFTNRSQGKFQ